MTRQSCLYEKRKGEEEEGRRRKKIKKTKRERDGRREWGEGDGEEKTEKKNKIYFISFMKTSLMSAQTIKPEDRLSPQREAFIDVSTPPSNIPKDSDLRQTGHGDVSKGGKCEVSSPCQSSIGVLAKTYILP